MKRKDIIDKLAEHGYTKTAADVILTDVVNVLMEALSEGEEVKLHGFGAFSVFTSKERRVKSLQTGEWEIVPPSKRVRFTAGRQLKRCLSEGFVRG